MPGGFDHVNHRVRERGGSGSVRDRMMDEGARFSKEVREAMKEQSGAGSRRSLLGRILRRDSTSSA
jgi:hypothetical protein